VGGNLLYYGDNLDILRRYVDAESVDLVYLDPPFNSNATYNVLFSEQSGAQAASQIKAFEDTWRWDEEAARTYFEVVEAGGRVSEALQAFRRIVGDSTMLAYVAMMAPRLVELRRVLKPTGSIYLHCDPTANHYLKLLMDAVFGPVFFRNEIVWKRTTAHSSAKRYAPVHDVLLYYSRSSSPRWNELREPYEQAYLDRYYKFDDGDGRLHWRADITGAGVRHGETGQPWRGIDVTAKGRHWAYPIAELERLDAEGRVYWPPRGTMPQEKRYRDDLKGKALSDVWTDVDRINPVGGERLGYPTQKPEALLERIIQASSNEGDVVLDPFCGCGTAVAVAQRLGRRWVGIDVTYLAIALIRRRLRDAYGESVDATYRVIGEPVSLPDAEALAASDPYQFQWWALDLVHARPVDQKKGADKGIDGRIYFHEGDASDTKQIVLSVKAGHTGRSHVHELRGVMEREGAAIGVLITMQPPTKPMREDAASAGMYVSPWGTHPRLQLLTVAELLEGKRIDCPPPSQVNVTFKKAPKAKPSVADPQLPLTESTSE
jgi:DNA modification methylase